jgi:hypothetical protein
VPHVRTVKTKSGATAVQVVWSSRRGSREIEHFGSAHDDAELEALKAAASQRVAAGQLELDLGLAAAGGGPLPITSSRMGHLLGALERGYRVLGLEGAAGGDEVFRHLVLARIIEPVSKLDSIRVLEEAGVTTASYRTIERRLPAYAQEEWRQKLSAACAAHARPGPARPGQPGALRREHAVLRDRPGRRVPRAGLSQLCGAIGYVKPAGVPAGRCVGVCRSAPHNVQTMVVRNVSRSFLVASSKWLVRTMLREAFSMAARLSSGLAFNGTVRYWNRRNRLVAAAADVGGVGHPVACRYALPGGGDVDVDAEHPGEQCGGKLGG